jgi:hypothetical protein
LARLLEGPHLARVIPQLAPETVHQLIRHCGLEACGEVVASATPAQVTSVLDLDLWRSTATGLDERFDADRFGEWIEVLVETGDPTAARIVASMDEDLVIAGLSRYIRVFDPGFFEPVAESDDEPFENYINRDGTLSREIGGYFVRAIRTDAWDAIVSLLLSLDSDYPETLHGVMRGCRQMSNSAPESDGLHDLYLAPEQLLHEVALERERRRSQQGYCTPSDARAFLDLARQRHGWPTDPGSMNSIASACLRTDISSVQEDETGAGQVESERHATTVASVGEDDSAPLDSAVQLLSEAGLVPQRPRALLQGVQPAQKGLERIRAVMDYVRESDEAAFLSRGRELAFLANVLVAGCSIQGRPFTPQEASDAVVGVCNIGLEQLLELPAGFLVEHDLVTAFEVGWAVLHHGVVLFAAGELVAILDRMRFQDDLVQEGLDELRLQLVKQLAAGAPWRARDSFEVLAIIDMPAWASLLGLVDQYPVIPDALTATLERRTGSISPTAFEFITTVSQVDVVRTFMTRLPEILGR